MLFVGTNNCSTVQPLVSTERAAFYREKATGMYSALPYALSQVIVEIPFVLTQTTYFTLIVYAMLSFQWIAAKFLWFFYIIFCSFLYFTYYGMMTVSISPNHQVASILASTFYSLFNLFSDFFIPRSICLQLAWTVYGQLTTQYGDLEDEITVPDFDTKQSIKVYVKDHFGYDIDFMGVVAMVLISFAVFFAFMYALYIKTLNFQNI